MQLAKELGKPDGPVHYLWHDGWADGPFRFHMTERAARSAGVRIRPRAVREAGDSGDAMVAMSLARARLVIE